MTAIHPDTPPANSPEPEGAPEETIFLSPRVLDEAAFERFSEALRELVDRARREQMTLGEIVRSAEQAGSRMERLADAQRLAMKSAGDMARRGEEARALLSTVDERLARADRAGGDLAARAAALDSTLARAESTLARAEEVLARVERVGGSIDDAAEAADRAERARLSLESMVARAEEILSRCEGTLREHERAAAEFAGPLAAERAGAAQTVRELRELADQSRSLIDRGARTESWLRDALGELECWRGVLLENERGGALPPAIESIVEELRAGVMRDLGDMARAMRRVVERGAAVEPKPMAPRAVAGPSEHGTGAD